MKTIQILFCIAMLATSIACNKDEAGTSSTSVTTEPMAEFFTSHQQQFQTFNLDAAQGGSINGIKGIEFSFPSNCFVTSGGQPVTGNVEIRLKEFVNKNDLILNKVFSVSDGRPLLSAGAYEIHVTKNGDELKLATGMTYEAKMPPAFYQPQMYVYDGTSNNAEYGKVDWVMNQSTGNNVTQSQLDSVLYQQYLTATGLGLVNCDHPYDSTFAVMNGTLPVNDASFVVIVDRNANMAIGLSSSNGVFNWNYAPTGKQLRICSTYKKDNKYYLSSTLVSYNGQPVSLPAYQEKTEAEIENYLSTL